MAWCVGSSIDPSHFAGFKGQAFHLQAVWPLINYLTPLCLGLPFENKGNNSVRLIGHCLELCLVINGHEIIIHWINKEPFKSLH